MLDLPQPLQIQLTQERPPAEAGSVEDKVADWAAAVQQLREIAQWILGGVIASTVAVFATSAFARLGQMSWRADADRIIAAAIGFTAAITAIAIVFRFGVRVIVPSGNSLQKLAASAQGSSDARARSFLYRLHDLDEATYPLSAVLANSNDADWKPWIAEFRRTLSFAVVKTRFDELMIAMIVALLVAVPGMLLFVWAANPPENLGNVPTETVAITTDASGAVIETQVTTVRPQPRMTPTAAASEVSAGSTKVLGR